MGEGRQCWNSPQDAYVEFSSGNLGDTGGQAPRGLELKRSSEGSDSRRAGPLHVGPTLLLSPGRSAGSGPA